MTRNRQQAAKYSVGKGKRHERRIANLLGEWTGVNFRRTPCSGGFCHRYATKVGEREFISDIMCDQPLSFAIEAKSEAGFSLDALLRNPTTCKFTDWWAQTYTDAMSVKLLPLLWFKPTPSTDWIALDGRGLVQFKIDQYPLNLIQYLTAPVYGGSPVKYLSADGSAGSVYLPTPYFFRWADIVAVVNPTGLFNLGNKSWDAADAAAAVKIS